MGSVLFSEPDEVRRMKDDRWIREALKGLREEKNRRKKTGGFEGFGTGDISPRPKGKNISSQKGKDKESFQRR
ncbi:hypothetical protein AKJ39_02630 [candidate division MSBL1 archaeon SCGC-AAA259J03]|uniref:Uncharacterized protein n=1 Tax=candidate division MSBL1 archaeon SCGC-AAA259J03 TaxID=1698269 RepID=A0A656YWQ6_9EURY|nr:hypothetical protein AKJ39_02630 [candidate division MSBL1 archaeon SCGC-AAA259J03]